jgi:hypothetical protein
MNDRAITDDGDFCAGGDSIPEWQLYLLHIEREKERDRTVVPMTFEQWRNWKREQEKAGEE